MARRARGAQPKPQAKEEGGCKGALAASPAPRELAQASQVSSPKALPWRRLEHALLRGLFLRAQPCPASRLGSSPP